MAAPPSAVEDGVDTARRAVGPLIINWQVFFRGLLDPSSVSGAEAGR